MPSSRRPSLTEIHIDPGVIAEPEAIGSLSLPGPDRLDFLRQQDIHAELVDGVAFLELPRLDEVLLGDTAEAGILQRPGEHVPALAGPVPAGAVAVLIIVAAGDEWVIGKLLPQAQPVTAVPLDVAVALLPLRRVAVRALAAVPWDDRPIDEQWAVGVGDFHADRFGRVRSADAL